MDDEQRQNVRLWIDALRSGDYQQGRHVLCVDNKYCCRGVEWELYQRHGPGDLHIEEENHVPTRFDSQWTLPPKKVADWLGIHTATQSKLVERNDAGHTFHQIADAIEGWLAFQEQHQGIGVSL